MTVLGNFFVGTDEPTSLNAGDLWQDTSAGSPFALKFYSGSEWLPQPLIARDGSGALVASVQVGTDGTITIAGVTPGIIVSPDGQIVLSTVTGGVTLAASGEVRLESGAASVIASPDGSIKLYPGAAGLTADLPTSDPAIASALWVDNGFVKVSAG